jgi:2-polyprenyl-3-methyl-5-hydroxy-6-metoxy-1,4-benzoquinol methylase
MLSSRYENDGVSILHLNELQQHMKQQVEKKVNDNIYEFKELACPICNQDNFELLSEKDRYGLYMPVGICKDCGLVYTNPRMNRKAYNEFYNNEYRKLYGGIESPDDCFFYGQYNRGRRIFRYIKSTGFFSNFEGKFVFEVGCGAGGILHYFREKGCRVKGVDLGKDYIDYGRNRYDLDLSVGTIDNLDLDSPPDLIIYSHVLEHVLDLNQELNQINRTLSNNGFLFVEVPGVKNLLNSYNNDFLRYLQNAHVYHFTLKSLNNLMTKNGFNLMAGNETISSVFEKKQSANSSRRMENDYLDVISYLERVEKVRTSYPFPLYKIKRLPRAIISRAFKSIGMIDPFTES